MKNNIFTFLIVILPFISFSQDVMFTHNSSRSILVYADNANLREKPTLDSKVICRLPSGTALSSAYENKAGIVNGKKGIWVKVEYKGKFGYLWNNVLVSQVIKSQKNIDYLFQFKGNEKDTEIKAFYKGKLVKTQSIINNDTLKFSYSQSLGVTSYSEGNDVFIFYFGDYQKSKIQYYTWDNNKFSEFKRPIKDQSFFNYNRLESQKITEQLVNFRNEPNTNSETISVLQFGTKIQIVQQGVKRDTINDEIGLWAKIACNKDTGYVWQDYLSLYYFDSYKDEELSFMIRNSDNYLHQIVAIRDKKIVDTFSFRGISNLRGAHSRGNMGMSTIQELIGVCYSGESCGVPSGDVLVAWDGGKFHKFREEGGTGDGGLSYGNSLIFPSNLEGEKDMIKVVSYDSESIDVYNEGKDDNNYESLNRSYLTRNYRYENWKLKEVYSETIELEKLLMSKFPSHKLQYFEKGDLNKDGREDVILYAIDVFNVRGDDYVKRKNKSLIVIALKNKRNKYFIKTYSKKMIVHEENSPLTKVLINSNGFSLNIYYSGYYNDENNPRQYFMDYKFDEKRNDFILDQVTEFFPPINYSGGWEKKEYSYKKNRISFKDSYHPVWE